jgi:hypothetical protein
VSTSELTVLTDLDHIIVASFVNTSICASKLKMKNSGDENTFYEVNSTYSSLANHGVSVRDISVEMFVHLLRSPTLLCELAIEHLNLARPDSQLSPNELVTKAIIKFKKAYILERCDM